MAKTCRAVLVERPGSPLSLFIANDDDDAVDQARRIRGWQSSFDLYEGDRLVIEHRPPTPDPATASPGLARDHPLTVPDLDGMLHREGVDLADGSLIVAFHDADRHLDPPIDAGEFGPEGWGQSARP